MKIINNMKRFRVVNIDFDSRATILNTEIREEWDERIKQSMKDNKKIIKESLVCEYGIIHCREKEKRFIDIGASPFSFISFHNKFLRQIRSAYVVGSFYPSLTGACALGERILNHLIIELRNDFNKTEEYKRVRKQKSFDNWQLVIDTLEKWGGLLSEVAEMFRELKKIRTEAIHFRPEIEDDEARMALEAILTLSKIITGQFAIIGNQPWFIQSIYSAGYIKKKYESDPFVKRIVLPNCVLVGPYHSVEKEDRGMKIKDDYEYEDREISDDEFARMLGDSRKKILA
jgi:hypothetical protein